MSPADTSPEPLPRPRLLGVWLLVVSLLLASFPLPTLAATTETEPARAAAPSDTCCPSERDAYQPSPEDDCCAPGERDDDPCCPEGCTQCQRPCCSGPQALIAPGASSSHWRASEIPLELLERTLRSALPQGVFHPPRSYQPLEGRRLVLARARSRWLR